ncbi:MAG: hydrogenase formation protein HypD [Candidatus Geothermincolia bacterium]
MKYLDEFRVPAAARELLREIGDAGAGGTFMEVCGTHTMAISKAGLRPLLQPGIDLVSGPGCPVCVASDADIDRAIAVAKLPDVVLTTFGDMMRVPGSSGSLATESARGADVHVVYSPLDALELARRDPDRKVVFLGVGFETTAPAVAASVLRARREGLENFYVLSMHKLVPPALRALVGLEGFTVDGFMLPGHVSVIIGSDAYKFLPGEFGMPCVVTGFETTDILQAILRLVEMRDTGPALEVEYSRAVKPGGNPRALAVMDDVFQTCDAEWRGLSVIPASGLALRDEYREMDAGRWVVEMPAPGKREACRCGEILCGRIRPTDCTLFGGACNPDSPVGPCMVSSEGTCASYYIYGGYADETGNVVE